MSEIIGNDPIETDVLEYKFYAPGIGNVLTVDAHTGARTELVQIKLTQKALGIARAERELK